MSSSGCPTRAQLDCCHHPLTRLYAVTMLQTSRLDDGGVPFLHANAAAVAGCVLPGFRLLVCLSFPQNHLIITVT